MILRVCMATLLLLAAPAFRYERPVQLAAGQATETCLALPAPLFSHAAPRLEDLRLQAGEQDVAYQVRVSGEDATAGQTQPQQILNLGERDGVVSFDVAMTEPRYSRLLLRLGRSHFSVLVQVSGSEHTGEPGVQFPEVAYSSDSAPDGPQERMITLPESSFRYLHFQLRTLTFDPVTPQDIAGVEVLSGGKAVSRYVPVVVAEGPSQQSRQSVYTFALPPNTPVDRLSFVTSDPAAVFSRTATLVRNTTFGQERDTPGEQITLTQPKREVAANTSGVDIASLEAVPRASTVTLTIDNGDDAPLSLRSLQLQMRERELCFLRKQDAAYMLRYGAAGLRAPQYDLTPIDASAANASMSTLGPERMLLTGVAEQMLPFTERHPVLLWIALVLVVGTLGLVAVRSAMKN